MRTNHALTRIIIYSLLTVLLLSILLVGLGLGSLTFHINVHNGNYETGGATVSAQSIQRLKIEWVTGTVYLKTAETDHIQFSESGATDEKTSLAYRIENNTLTILFQKNNVIQFIR